VSKFNGDIPGPELDRSPGSEPDHIPGWHLPAIAPQHAVVVPMFPRPILPLRPFAFFKRRGVQRSSGEASIERDVIGFGEPDEREE